MSFIRNMKLKRKMMFGFSMSIVLMLIALGFAIFGLSSNNEDVKMVNIISEEANMAALIQKELLESQKVFKTFQLTGDVNLQHQFTSHKDNMMRYLQSLKEINVNEERKAYISDLEVAMYDYSDGFSFYKTLDESRLDHYETVGQYGVDIIEALRRMSNTAHDLSEEEVQMNVGKGLESILLARLSAMKYFTFHEEVDYQTYQEAFKSLDDHIENLSVVQRNLNYKSDFALAKRNTGLYGEGMISIHNIIVKLDDQIDLMETKEVEISDAITKIGRSVLNEQSQFETAVEKKFTTFTSMAMFISLVAILVATGIASWILRLVLVPIESLRKTFESISSGDVDMNFRLSESSEDEIGLMARAFNKFMVNLKAIMDDVNYQNWSKTAQNELTSIIREQEDMVALSQNVLTYLCHYINAQVGTLYLCSEKDDLSLVATYAYKNRKGLQETISFGDGLVGQSALEKKTFIIEELPEDYMAVQSGLGSSQPTSIAVVPCVHEGQVRCVIELGTLSPMTQKELKLLELLSESIAIALHSTDVRIKMKELLDKTVHQSEELQMQQEELRQSNEELEEQTRALKTSEKRLQTQQEELRVSNEELEERTKQLEEQKKVLDGSNKELISKQREIMEKAEALELANTYKSEFLANMSHELRTPLNSILVLSQLLSDRDDESPLTQKEKEFAHTINTSGRDLLTLINDILDLSKVEAGHLDIHADKIMLEDLLAESENMFSTMADMKSIEFKTKLGDGLPESIVSDVIRIQQIIKNLVSNAIKFTDKGEVTLVLRRPSDEECAMTHVSHDQHIAIEVADTGIGIAKDKQHLIFEAFRQTDGTTSRKYGGTGLGLTISRELAHLLGGRILLESEEGSGSQFVLLLPMTPDYKEDKSLIVERDKRENTIAADLEAFGHEQHVDQGAKLLIIEDDENFANILSDLSEEKGFDCITAHTGQDGLKMAREMGPSAIILDLGLPDMDGMDLAEKLGELEETRHIPIHIVSGKDQEDGSMPSSVIGFLKKPVEIKTIYQTLSKIESVSKSDFKKLLVVGHCGGDNFEQFSKLGHVDVRKVETGREAQQCLDEEVFECLILDIDLEDMGAETFLAGLSKSFGHVPVIIYSELEIDISRLEGINEYTDNIILKSPKSEERLIDEVSLFLHGMSQTRDVDEVVHTGRSAGMLKPQIGLTSKNQTSDAFDEQKILVVDDDDRNVFALTNVLKKHGLEVVVADNGLDAIEALKKNQDIDLVLMDIMMPKMDGYDAIRAIRQLDQGKDIPIIALTAKAMKDDRDKCVAAGANDYMTKPIDIQKLLSLLKVWMV